MYKYEVKKPHKIFYQVLESHSKATFMALMSFKPFQIIFKEFLKSQDFEEMVETDPTLSTSKEVFREKAGDLLQLMDQI